MIFWERSLCCKVKTTFFKNFFTLIFWERSLCCKVKNGLLEVYGLKALLFAGKPLF